MWSTPGPNRAHAGVLCRAFFKKTVPFLKKEGKSENGGRAPAGIYAKVITTTGN
jgi:hypothetical protein